MNTIYGLVDPRSGYIRYVGMTRRRLDQRLREHWRTARNGEQTYRAKWMRRLLSLGLEPLIVVIEQTPDRKRECFWIAHYSVLGSLLTNDTEGGEGGSPMLGKKHSSETKEKMRQAAKTSERAKQQRAELHRSLTGKPKSEEHRQKMSAALTGRKPYIRSEETKLKLREAWKVREANGVAICPRPAGWKHTDEAKAKMRRGHKWAKKKPMSEETKAKISAAKTGKKRGGNVCVL